MWVAHPHTYLHFRCLNSAGVAERYTRQSQKLFPATGCGFESHHRHPLSSSHCRQALLVAPVCLTRRRRELPHDEIPSRCAYAILSRGTETSTSGMTRLALTSRSQSAKAHLVCTQYPSAFARHQRPRRHHLVPDSNPPRALEAAEMTRSRRVFSCITIRPYAKGAAAPSIR